MLEYQQIYISKKYCHKHKEIFNKYKKYLNFLKHIMGCYTRVQENTVRK